MSETPRDNVKFNRRLRRDTPSVQEFGGRGTILSESGKIVYKQVGCGRKHELIKIEVGRRMGGGGDEGYLLDRGI